MGNIAGYLKELKGTITVEKHANIICYKVSTIMCKKHIERDDYVNQNIMNKPVPMFVLQDIVQYNALLSANVTRYPCSYGMLFTPDVFCLHKRHLILGRIGATGLVL